MAYEKRSFRITKPEEQTANTWWNVAFFLYMHGLLVCGWCSLYMISHAAREAYVGICNGTHAVAHSGHIRGMHRILQWNACTTAHASHEATVDRM